MGAMGRRRPCLPHLFPSPVLELLPSLGFLRFPGSARRRVAFPPTRAADHVARRGAVRPPMVLVPNDHIGCASVSFRLARPNAGLPRHAADRDLRADLRLVLATSAVSLGRARLPDAI